MTKPSSASGVTFRPLDDLFEPTDGSSDKPQLAELDIESLIPFKDHPFREYPEEKMQEMVESVTEHGILMPILVRPHKSGEGYEIISGHNRVEACRRAGIKTIPATIREMDDDTAVILMVDSNLRQRDKLLPSEKAKAYQMKMEAIKRKAGRPEKNSCQVGTNFRADKAVAENTDDSARQVQRFIRLNSLSAPLLDYVDEGTLAFNPAVEVSYLDPADQQVVYEIMERDQISPSLSQAQKLHKLAQIGKISEDAIEAVMTVEKPMYETITFRRNTVEKYFPAGTSGREIEKTIIRLLEEYQKKRENKKTYEETR
ncbi:MAG: ParB/RepB/Spo0J family partition protein [Lachnospiraceae bacterium]|nr:ParB/RepB/Spo0J family partition protein [Lachnospiraceae bacterium]